MAQNRMRTVERPIRRAAARVVPANKQNELVKRIKLAIAALRATSDRSKRSTLLDELLVLTRLLSDLIVKEKRRMSESPTRSRALASCAGRRT